MKKFVSFLCVSLIITGICLSFNSCREVKNEENEGSRNEKIQNENDKTLSFLRSGISSSETSNPVIAGMENFKKAYSRDVEYVSCGYDEWNQKITASIASGDPIDVINAGDTDYPLLAMRKMTMPIEEYVDMKNENINYTVSKKLFSYRGKIYNASPVGSTSPLMIYYNKTGLENEGVPDLFELYKKDEWTTEKLREIAINFTRDTNGDNQLDQWGLSAWYCYAFLGGSAANACIVNEDGMYELTMDNNDALIEALELVKSAWSTDKWVGVDGGDIYDSFYRQKNIMLNEFSWAGDQIMQAKEKGQFSFDVGVVPFPYGKENKQKENFCYSDGFSIMNGSDCPNSAGMLIEYVINKSVEEGDLRRAKLPEGWLDIYKEAINNPFLGSYNNSAINGADDLCRKVSSGTDIMTAIESYKPRFQALIDNANKIPEDPKDFTFNTIDLTFKDNIDAIEKASDEASLNVTHDNDCLKVVLNTYEYGEVCDAFKTIPAKNPIYGYKKYNISFEYKVDKIPNVDLTSYSFSIQRKGTDNPFAIFAPSPDSVGKFTAYSLELDGVPSNEEDLYLLFKGHYADTIYIKNLKIEEIKD